MTTELQLPPAPEIVEVPEEDFDIPDMIAHLYQRNTPGFAMCGAPSKNDPHLQMHMNSNRTWNVIWFDHNVCPDCGAPTCPTCVAIAKEQGF